MSKNNILPDLLLCKYNRRKNARKLILNTANCITEGKFVQIGGIEQWITIRGEDNNNPILLFIHGGPASPYSIFSPLLRSWEKHFTIVQWDQRGAGKTFRKNGKEGSGVISFERLAQDGIEVTHYICKRLKQHKVILVGSSVGSLIAMIMLKRSSNLFHAYVGTDQNAPDPQFVTYKLMLDALENAGHTKGVQLIKKMGPDCSKWDRNDYDKINQCIVKSVKNVPNMIMDLMLPSMLSSPDHKLADTIDIFKGMNFTLDYVYKELMTFNLWDFGMKFDLPFFIFQGDKDILTPTENAKAYFDKIEAPHKEFVLIKNAGHLACFARPDQFLDELIKRVSTVVRAANNTVGHID